MTLKHLYEFSKNVGNTPLIKLECEEPKNRRTFLSMLNVNGITLQDQLRIGQHLE
ncbi:hypothetical protein ACUXG3_001039 [Bacillus thuringiensis]|uniref:Uncharacterized protein n=1 Tax=Bacillus thuringiensis TaxID=1428 RepID=A0A9X5RMZ2_BACTU|nr:hypothetical protein FXB61_000118 [Bacillus cereus]OFC91573.1 hypothetical protein BTGOE4_32710 [Bacillus thuringiensis]